MKNITPFVFIASLIVFCSCGKDCLDYKNYRVDFFSEHENFKIIEPVFETVTEQVLIKEDYKQGAKFETVTEQVLVKQSYTYHEILDSQKVHLVVNAESNTIQEIACYHFFDEADFIETTVPAEYKKRSYKKVLEEGTGAPFPAVYGTISHERLISDSEIIALERERIFNQITFRIPNNMTIREYLADQFKQQSIEGCNEGSSYNIHN